MPSQISTQASSSGPCSGVAGACCCRRPRCRAGAWAGAEMQDLPIRYASSMRPLQSLSRPSQPLRCPRRLVGRGDSRRPIRWSRASRQRPRADALLQATIVGAPRLSSTTPSQSLSRPSQISTPPLVFMHSVSQPAGRIAIVKSGRQAHSVQTPLTQVAVANGNEHWWLQPPQLLGSRHESKPSSMMPLQSLSRPSQISTPPLVCTQPLAGSLSAS